MKNKTSQKLKMIVALLIMVNTVAISCTCQNQIPYFCHAIQDTDHVISAVVLNFPDDPDSQVPELKRFMTVQVVDNLRFEIEPTEIVISGQDGLNCGVFLGNFEPGDSLILALNPWITDTIEYWYLTYCPGPHYLRLDNNICTGPYDGGIDTVSIVDLKSHLDEDFCPESLIIDAVEDQSISLENISIFPNPTQNILNIKLEDDSLVPFSTRIYNISGQEFFVNINNNIDATQLDVTNLPSGIYMIQVVQDGKVGYDKFVKE